MVGKHTLSKNSVNISIARPVFLGNARQLSSDFIYHLPPPRLENLPSLLDTRRTERDYSAQINQEHDSRLHELHQQRAREAAHREAALRGGEEVRAECAVRARADLRDVVDEVASDGD